MIKLKSLLHEVKKLDVNKKEDAAEYLIRLVWKHVKHGEDQYDFDELILWIDNDRDLNDIAERFALKFYPNSDEPMSDFREDIKNVLIKMEESRLERRKRLNPSLQDPLYILKKIMVGKNWNRAKQSISGQIGYRSAKGFVSDEDAELLFNRLYKNAMGETIYDKEMIEKYGYGRLSQLHRKDAKSEDNVKQYSINAFLNHYGINDSFDGKVRVWRGTNSPHSVIRPGDFVTFDRGYAESYMSGKYKTIVTDVLYAKDLILYKADPGMSELVYWPEGHEIKKYEGEIPTLHDFWERYRFGL